MSALKKLCVLPNGHSVYVGSTVRRTDIEKDFVVSGIRTEDGDKYLTFDDGSQALVAGTSDFWRKYSGGCHIHLK